MLNIWTQPSGYTWTQNQFGYDSGRTYFDERKTIFDLGPIVERINVNLPLPVSRTTGITYTVISGSLPPGMTIRNNSIQGISYGIVRDTTFTFCIRASDGTNIADRTFNITVATGGPPKFITKAGLLPLGTNNQKYILNNSFINYQLQAVDYDDQPINYFIAAGDGKLPPGVSLSSSGLLTGFVNPVLTVPQQTTGIGEYDNDFYDSGFYDFASRPTNGYDSYKYDLEIFDFNTPTLPPSSINQLYEFVVTAVAGVKSIRQTFAIFVVSPELLTADDTVVSDDTTVFTADVTPLEPPLFVNDTNLGTFRANNYVLVEINTFTSSTTVNPTFALTTTAKAWGYHTIYAVNDIVMYNSIIYICATAHTSGSTFDADYWVTQSLPIGMSFSPVGSVVYIAGQVPFQTNISKTYRFSITGTRTSTDIQPATTSKVFTITIIGEINNTISWTTNSNLGTIPANYNSNLKVEAKPSNNNATIIYSLDLQKGEIGLPPGLSLDISGEITGKVNQFGVPNIKRVTTFENGSWYLDRHFTTIDANHQYDILGARGLILFDQDTGFSIDSGNTTFDRTYKFTVKATDQYGFAISNQQFILSVATPNQILYSNIRTQPYLKPVQKSAWTTFINDPTIFTIGNIYRPADPAFGVQTSLSMLVYAGVETTHAAAYVGAMGLNHKRKRFQFGSIKKGVAIQNGSSVYEVVYIEMIDPLETSTGALPHSIKYPEIDTLKITADESGAIWTGSTTNESWLDRPIESITVDSNAFKSNDLESSVYYPNSITNWRRNIEAVGPVERNYLPVWMRSIQPGQKQQLGFKLAVPLCYCKPGTADSIILNIKHSGFDFRTLDYTVDRYIIDSVDGYSNDKYLVFRNDRITV